MTLEELKKEIRPLDETSMEQAKEHWIKIAKPLFSLGKLEDAVIQMAGIKETPDYELKKKALVIMCADNGIVEEGVTQTGQEVTAVVADHTQEQFDLAMYSGLYAVFYYMQACYPYLKETKGSVINFASGAGLFGNYGQCAYAAAKEGIRGLTRVAATEWGPDGINVNIVCPLAWTAQLEKFEQAYPDAFKANVKMPPAGHYADAEKEIGRVCVQLASPDFKYMSGETLTLEGGMGQRP